MTLWSLILSALVLCVLVGITIPYARDRIGRIFLLFLGAALLWIVGFIFEITQESPAGKILLVRLQFIGISLLPMLWFLLSAEYVKSPVKKWVWSVLLVVPLITQIFVWAVPYPNLFWGTPTLTESAGPFTMIDYDYGPWFYFVHAPYGYLLILTAVVFYVRSLLLYHREFRRPIFLLLIAIALPIVADIVYILGFSPFHSINLAPIAMGISGFIVGYVLLKYRFFRLLPIARSVIIESMDEGIIVLNENRCILDINRAITSFFPDCGFAVGRELEECSRGPLIGGILHMIQSGTVRMDITVPAVDSGSEERIFDVCIRSITRPEGEIGGRVVSLRDITERVQLYEKVRSLAIHDDLTGAFNRRYILETGSREISRVKRGHSSSVGVVMLDLDGFKGVNDNYGHNAGDELLIALSQAASSALRDIDSFGRIGGDEFAAILPDTSTKEGLVAAEHVREAIAEVLVASGGERVSVSASIGVSASADFSDEVPTIEDLFHAADVAMYTAKRSGKNRIVGHGEE